MTSARPKSPKPVSKEQRTQLRRYAQQAANMVILSMLRRGEYQLVEVPEEQRLPLPVADDASADAIVAAATAIAERRAARLQQLRTALQGGDRELALNLAATLCGLREAEDEASHSASTRLN
jgi:hypothetical protein